MPTERVYSKNADRWFDLTYTEGDVYNADLDILFDPTAPFYSGDGDTGGGGPAVDQAARDAASQAQQEVDALEEVVADLPDGATDQQARDAVAALKTRTSLSKTTASLAPGASETFTLAVPRSFTLLTLGVSAQARIRAYGTTAARTADEARAFGADVSNAVYPDLSFDSVLPVKDSLTDKVLADFSPNAQGEWFMRVTNTGSGAAAITLSLAILPREAVS